MTVGVPVATTASTSSRCTPGRSSDAVSLPSPTVPRPNSPAWSPTTTTATSAARGRGDGLVDAGAVVALDGAADARTRPASPRVCCSASSTVGIAKPSGRSGWVASTWFANE